MPRAHASQVAEAELGPLLAELADHLRYAYLEGTTGSRWSRFDPALPLDDAVRGRAFGAACDVQFQRRRGGYQVTVLTDLARPIGATEGNIDLASLDSDEVTYLLWGRRSSGDVAWRELRFSQTWQYPLDGAPVRVGVRAVEYRDHATADLQFVRYLDLVPLPDQGEDAQ